MIQDSDVFVYENENMEISAYNGNGSMYGDDLL